MDAALKMDVDACINLYRTVKDMPSTSTRGFIEKDMHVSINGPMSLAQVDILIAFDLEQGKFLCIKLLRLVETISYQSNDQKEQALQAEITACKKVLDKEITGLVKCEVVKATVSHADDLRFQKDEEVFALKMDRYMSSLADAPQLTEKWLLRGFSRIYQALESLHALGLVHMDVKSDNVFMDSVANFDLGDFGSTREIGACVWSFTQIFNPYAIPSRATVIPAMDFVCLCVMIAFEMNKGHWKEALCGQQQSVQHDLVLEKLNLIQDENFKTEVVSLFEENYKIVQLHLQNY